MDYVPSNKFWCTLPRTPCTCSSSWTRHLSRLVSCGLWPILACIAHGEFIVTDIVKASCDLKGLQGSCRDVQSWVYGIAMGTQYSPGTIGNLDRTIRRQKQKIDPSCAVDEPEGWRLRSENRPSNHQATYISWRISFCTSSWWRSLNTIPNVPPIPLPIQVLASKGSWMYMLVQLGRIGNAKHIEGLGDADKGT